MEQKLKDAKKIRMIGNVIILVSIANLILAMIFAGIKDYNDRRNPADKLAETDSRVADSWRQSIERFCMVTPGDGKRYYIVYNKAVKTYDSLNEFNNDYFYYVIVQDESERRLYMPENGSDLLYVGIDAETGQERYISPPYGVKTYLADDYTLSDMTHLSAEFQEAFSLCEENANNILSSIPTFESDDVIAQLMINPREASGINVLIIWVFEVILIGFFFFIQFILGLIIQIIGVTRVRAVERKIYMLNNNVTAEK